MLEMMVVLAVISIIFLLTIPNISKSMSVVDNKGCESLTKVVDAAIMEYRLEYDTFPNSISELISAGYLSDQQSSCSNGQSISISSGQAVAQ